MRHGARTRAGLMKWNLGHNMGCVSNFPYSEISAILLLTWENLDPRLLRRNPGWPFIA
jgi:hypothetical protein